jgi:uncharacterized protein (TIGR02171 family)
MLKKINDVSLYTNRAHHIKVKRLITALRVILAAALLLSACLSPTRPSSSGPLWAQDAAHPGMHIIYAAGKSFMQGANDAYASASDLETPPMKTTFTYNYSIDTTDVTQQEYFAVTGKQPDLTSSYGRGNRCPVSYVSWYDAVLFCNAKSKLNGLDTVYSYFAPDTISSGSVNAMASVTIHYDRDGYRLPTESEWEFAARGASSNLPFATPADSPAALASAWFAENSADTCHPVALLKPNGLGLYDMAGNVYEWTGDWKGPYNTKGTTNSIGAEYADSNYERTIKGGSFEHPMLYLRPSRRSATYPVSLVTACEFIGFRCAQGVIPSPNDITTDTSVVQTNPVALTTASVQSFLGTNAAKLVFVNVSGANRTLCTVNFNQPKPAVYEFTDSRSVNVPEISPNGRYVAWCTRGEGSYGPSNIYIRYFDSLTTAPWKLNIDSGYIPRWWVDRTTNDTFLIYTNSAIDNSQSGWPATKTFMQMMAGGKPSGSPQALVANGGFHDGLSTNRQYVVTGYTRLLMRDITGADSVPQRQLFLPPLNGKDSSGSTQVCNVSISQDTANPSRCLFLDFGCTTVSTLTQSTYGIHQYLFIADYTGRVIAWYNCPSGESAWNFPEWSNTPSFAAASGCNSSMDANALYLVNIQNGNYLQVAQGTELENPSLWAGTIIQFPQNLSEDSLGAYDTPDQNAFQEQFAGKMHLFWKMHRTLNVAFVGSSQISNGVDCHQLTGGLVGLNLGVGGAAITTCAHINQDYLILQAPNLKVIGMSTTPYWLNDSTGECMSPPVWIPCIEQSEGYLYDQNHNFWRNGLPPLFDSLMQVANPYTLGTFDTLGLCLSDCDGWGPPPPATSGSITWTVTDTNYIRNFNIIAQIAAELAALQIHFVMINFPENPGMKNTPYYMCEGPSWATGDSVMQQFKALGNNNPYFHFFDQYNNGNPDYDSTDFTNQNHLCTAGAAKMGQRVDSLIHSFLGQ